MFSRRVSFVMAGVTGAATLTAASAPSPLYPVYQRLWGFSAFTLTLVFAVYVFALLVALLTVGSLSDRVGRRPVACAALVLLALGMLVFALADDVGTLMIARIVQGFAVGAATGTTTAMCIDAAPNARAGGIVSSAVPPLGIAIGSILSGALVQYAPLPRQLVFWVLGACYLGLAVAVWWIPDRTDRAAAMSRARIWRSLLPSAGLPSTVRPAFLAVLPSIVATWALSGLYLSLGSSLLSSVFGLHSHLVVGIALAAFFLAGITGIIASAFLPPRLREWSGHAALVAGLIVTVVALSTSTLAIYVVGSVIAGFGFGASFRLAVDAVAEASPPGRRGQVFATLYIVSYLAFSVPALAAGLAAEAFGLEATAVAYGVAEIALCLLAVLAALARSRRRADRRAPHPRLARKVHP